MFIMVCFSVFLKLSFWLPEELPLNVLQGVLSQREFSLEKYLEGHGSLGGPRDPLWVLLAM